MHRPTTPTPRRRPARRAAAGLTLIELMVVLCVAVVALALAGPQMAAFSANQRVAAAKSALAAGVALARVEAVRRGMPVRVVARTGGTTGNAFAAGWIVAVDANADGVVQNSETRLRRGMPPGLGVRLDGPTSFGFAPSGALIGGNELAFVACGNDTQVRGQRLLVAPSGVVESFVATADDCAP